MIDLDELETMYGPYKNYPTVFVQFPHVNEILDAIPGMIDRIRLLEAAVQAAEILEDD